MQMFNTSLYSIQTQRGRHGRAFKNSEWEQSFMLHSCFNQKNVCIWNCIAELILGMMNAVMVQNEAVEKAIV